MTRHEVIEAIVKAANDKIDEFSPKSINGMNVKWMCEFAGVQFNTPIIKIQVRSHKLNIGHPLSIDKIFGVGFVLAIEMLQAIKPIPDQEDYMRVLIADGDTIVDYYSRKLSDIIERMFYDYLKQIRQHDKEVLAGETIENDFSK